MKRAPKTTKTTKTTPKAPPAPPPPAAAVDPVALARAVLAPARPRLAEVLALLREVDDDPREAWEACVARELVPASWLDGGTREIVSATPCAACGAVARGRARHAAGCEQAGTPPDGAALVALASDAAAITQVEALAREAAERFDVHDPSAGVVRVVWHVTAKPEPSFTARPGADVKPTSPAAVERDVEALCEALEARGYDAGVYDRFKTYGDWPAWGVVLDAWKAWAWPSNRKLAARRDNPFAPLLEIWSRGYVLEGFDDDAIVLSAPAYRAPDPAR